MSSSDTDSVEKVDLSDEIKTSSGDLVEADDVPFKLSSALSSWFGKASKRDDDAIATRRSVYDDPQLAKLYWPKQDYENIHRFELASRFQYAYSHSRCRFDPNERWTYKEERVQYTFLFALLLGHLN